MKGFAPRSADWLVLRREADSRAPIRTEPIYPGGFAFSDSKAEPKRRKTGQCSSTGSWFCWDESSSYYCLCWSSTLNRYTASVVDGLIQEVNASESDAHGSR